jgi:anaerobic selenocysteine-containing dehydrogenase
MATRVVRGACPHDCPDTCAMHTTVEDGRAVRVAGDPDHPITVGFLCGKVSNYLDRVYSEDRILHPLVREDGAFRRAGWDEALDRIAAGLTGAREEFGGESILPYSYMGTQGLIQGNTMSARVMNALGASALERTICATAGYTGTAMTHGISPEVDPEEWPHARHVLIWGWNPLSTAPHLWRKLLDARANGARLVVVDPFRSRTARVADEHLRPLPGSDAALAIGMMRAVLDAGLHDEEWCRAHAEGYEGLLAELQRFPVEHWADLCGVPAEDVARAGREFASNRPALLRLGVGAQRHMGAPAAYATIASLPALTGAWRDRGGGCSYIPLATAAAVSSYPLEREDLRPGAVRTINMSQLGAALTDSAMDPPVKALVCWSSNPAAIAPDQGRVLEGLRRDDLFTVVLEQFMTDTAAHADVVLPSTTQLEHLDLERAGDRAARRGEAKHRGVPADRRAARARRSLLPRDRRRAARRRARGLRRGRAAHAGLAQDRPGAGAGAARARRVRHRVGASDAARSIRAAGGSGGRRAGGALPAGDDHAEDASLPQLDVRESAAAALGAACACSGVASGGCLCAGRLRRQPGEGVQWSRFFRVCREGLRRRPSWRRGRSHGLVERRLPGGPERAGHDLAAPDRGRQRPDLQRQPGRGPAHLISP